MQRAQACKPRHCYARAPSWMLMRAATPGSTPKPLPNASPLEGVTPVKPIDGFCKRRGLHLARRFA
eukprot:762484-Pleurochrysis_carterae.AAC.1